MNRKQKKLLLRILLAAVEVLILHFVPVVGYIRLGFYLIPYLTVSWDILKKALLGILHGQIFDENFLMAVATLGALLLALTRTGEYTEAVAVMLFYQTGELFQSYAVGKSRRSIAKLMDIRPDYANIIRNGTLVQVSPEEIPVDSVIIVQPGERIPLDGVVTEGSSLIDSSALTGESLPRFVSEGSEVISGCVNGSGLLHLRTTGTFENSTVSRILELVENAGSRKARPERFISKFARYYTPAVCIAALLLAVVPPLAALLLSQPPLWGQWLYRALSFLVISCPCALVISIPLSFFAAIGGAGRQGILIKGANYLETLSKVRTMVLDKTGTLTEGQFQVTEIESLSLPKEQVLEYAALAEIASSHPLGKGILLAYGKPIVRRRISALEELGGLGITARIDGHRVLVGSASLLKGQGISLPFSGATAPGSTVYVAVDGSCAGRIILSDRLKDSAKTALRELKKLGVRRLILLTGDQKQAALQTATALEIDEFHHSLLPGDKVHLTEQFLSQCKAGEKLCFAGDGINDAPVLSRADVGIAMGAMGSDAAIEAADVVLMDDDPRKLPLALRLSRRCMRLVRENILFALGVKLLCLLLGALGIGGLWLAIFADVGVMVLAILNAMRALLPCKA